jgi:hypothetical protein
MGCRRWCFTVSMPLDPWDWQDYVQATSISKCIDFMLTKVAYANSYSFPRMIIAYGQTQSFASIANIRLANEIQLQGVGGYGNGASV